MQRANEGRVVRPNHAASWYRLSFSAFYLLFLLAGCAPKGGRVVEGNQKQILYWGNGADPADLDPQTTIGEPESHIFNALFEGLVSQDPRDLHPIPGVAESWDLSPDDCTYTFHLRHNARWSNGDPVTSRDFLDSYRRILSPALAAPYASMMFDDVEVPGARDFYEGRLTDFSKVGFEAPDPYTFIIHLRHPASYFLGMLNHESWYPVHLPTILKYGGFDQKGTAWTRVGHLVGNGPFRLKDWKVNEEVVVEKEPNYWNAAAVRLREIHYYNTENIDTEERDFRAGQLHVTNELPIPKIDWYRQHAPQFLRLDPYLGVYFYRFNVTLPVFQDARVRRALSMAIDREGIVKDITRAGQQPAHTYVPPNPSGYECRNGIPTNYEAARQLLAEAGHPGGRGLGTIEILTNTSQAHRAVAEAIQQTWREQLGVDARIQNVEWKVFIAAGQNLDYCVSRYSWIGDYSDPFTFLSLFTSGNGNNNTGYANPEYDRLIVAAHAAATDAERLATFQQAETLLLQDAPIAPIYFYTRCYLIQPSVKGWYGNIQDRHMPQFIYLDENAPMADKGLPLAVGAAR